MDVNRAILCIDDDEDDLEMLHITFSQLVPHFTILTARSGEEGLLMLHSLSKEKNLPCLIILDINMPRMDGRETLAEIKADPFLKDIPVVIFSTSTSLLDKTYFGKMNISYFVKPIDMNQFRLVVQQLLQHCIPPDRL